MPSIGVFSLAAAAIAIVAQGQMGDWTGSPNWTPGSSQDTWWVPGALEDCASNPPIQSYHIHVFYRNNNLSSITLAQSLHRSFMKAVNISMEAHRKGKKKKTKKKRGDFDECMEPEAKNFTLCFISFVFTCGPATAYVNVLGATLKKFQETAYYPYAGLSSGAYVAFGGQALIFVGMLFSLCRMYGCCGAGGNDEEGTGAPYQGPPHGYGVAGGYGAGYGEGYGGYEQHGGYGEGYGEAAGGYGQAGAYY